MVTKEDLRESVAKFLRRNFPQIQGHGGSSNVSVTDAEKGELSIILGGACSGCGISPMTTQMIKKRLPMEVEEVTSVDVETQTNDFDDTAINSSMPKQDTDDIDAPF